MENYKHILLAVDFFGENKTIINRAKDLADRYQAKLSLIHVVESMPITSVGYDRDISFDMDLMTELTAVGKKRLCELALSIGVNAEDIWIEMGSPKAEIVRIAQENKVDLIIIGSHGRHGLGLLLGSTANGVLHHAQCDVLAIRLQDN